jgi:hypothetical protein
VFFNYPTRVQNYFNNHTLTFHVIGCSLKVFQQPLEVFMSVLIAHSQSLQPTAENAVQAACVILVVAAIFALAVLADTWLMKRSCP